MGRSASFSEASPAEQLQHQPEPSEREPMSVVTGGMLRAAFEAVLPSKLSIREVREGDGAMAQTGMWVKVHYTTRLIGDGSLIEDTRTSGFGDRDYGEPCFFELGDMKDPSVLRVLHSAALDMRVGGKRRVRTSLLEPSFGYRRPPKVTEVRESDGMTVPRRLQGDWLMEVDMQLEAVQTERPPSLVLQVLAMAREKVGL